MRERALMRIHFESEIKTFDNTMYYRCVGDGSHILTIDLFWRVIATYRMMYEHSYVAINVHVASVPVFAFAYVYAYTPVYVYHNR